jgi:drug/metabolite transporter (DMT)-like permease
VTNPKTLVLITVFIWSFGALYGRIISLKSQYLLLELSFLFTFISLLFFNLKQYKNQFFNKVFDFKLKYALVGIFGYFVYWIAFIQTFRAFNSASEPAVLNYTWPVFTVLFTEALFRKDKIVNKKKKLLEALAIVLGFAAVVILSTRGEITAFQIFNSRGLFWGLVTGASYGFFSAYSSLIPKDDQAKFLLYSIFFSLILITPLSISELGQVYTFTSKELTAVFLLGFMNDGVGYVLWTRANRIANESKISISSVASLTFLLPLFSLIIISVALKEFQLFESYFYISLILLIFSTLLSQRSDEIASKI